jgi:hypothetical protein
VQRPSWRCPFDLMLDLKQQTAPALRSRVLAF